MKYVRFVASLDGEQEPVGLFSALYRLEKEAQLGEHEVAWFREHELWFNTHLLRPGRLARSRRSGAALAAVLWFKDTAEPCLTRMHALSALLREKDISVDMLITDKPGYIVYEDQFQVAAEPFGS